MYARIAATIRSLSADMVEEAQSGHPGLPLGCAEIATVLFSEILQHDPTEPNWPNRDRFVLSAGHGSALLYSILHLSGYAITIEDLHQFRQLHSITPGHPELGLTPGVETTTGPLGQGFANAVGMALAERLLAAKYNRPETNIIDHFTYALSGDGCLMEGISAEAASLAGSLGLGKLIVIYDSNHISIEGDTKLAFTEDVGARFIAYNWQVLPVNGHNPQELKEALNAARQETTKPTLIIAKTTIAKGSPLAGSHETHGAPLGKDNVLALKHNLGLPDDEFFVPEDVYQFFHSKQLIWQELRQKWEETFATWGFKYPELKSAWDRSQQQQLPAELLTILPRFEAGSQLATREAGGKVLNILAEQLETIIGGSADLAPSTKTYINNSPDINATNFSGRNLHFGVREHAMGAILNGISIHGGFRVYGSTFLVFADYMRPAIRLAALMRQPVIFIFTHDSIYVGEDGPTHQPVEQLDSLRLIPNLQVIRPADANETVWGWQAALTKTDGPTALILSRQKLPTLTGTSPKGFTRGGYVVKASDDVNPDLVILASGSEVALALKTVELLAAIGKTARVISVPCRETFINQDPGYLNNILGDLPLVVIEAGVDNGWYKLLTKNDLVISIDRFGASGPAEAVAAYLGFTPEGVLARIKQTFQW